MYQHSCVVFTTGAAIVTLLRWLCDVRHKVGHDASALLRDRVVFCLQKSKASRIEQPSAVICENVRTLLRCHGSPFKVQLVDSTTQLEGSGPEVVAWLHSPAFATLSFLVHASRCVLGRLRPTSPCLHHGQCLCYSTHTSVVHHLDTA